MSKIAVDTKLISNNINSLKEYKQYYERKKTVFTPSYFGTNVSLSKYLKKLQNIYEDIGNNINNIIEYLEDYTNDLEGIENNLSESGTGTFESDEVGQKVRKTKGIIEYSKIENELLFKIESYQSTNGFDNFIEGVKTAFANFATCGLAFGEGIVNVGETIIDGGEMLVASGSTLIGKGASLIGLESVEESLNEFATSIGESVKVDLSKDLYYDVLSLTGLDQYANPDSTGAHICSFVGNIGGTVALSLLTAGGAAAVFGEGTVAAAGATAIGGGVTGALRDMGSEAELALQNGANIEQAEIVGGIGAIVGAITGSLTGSISSSVRNEGARLGKEAVKKIAGKALEAFGIAASEPIIDEIAHTVVYKNDGDILESLKDNFINDGVLSQILMQGLGSAGGVVANGIKGVKLHNKVDLNQTLPDLPILKELNEEELNLKVEEYNNLLEDEQLKRIIQLESEGKKVNIPDNLQDKHSRLKELELEIESKIGYLTERETSLLNEKILKRVAEDYLDLTLKSLSDEELLVKQREYYRILNSDERLTRYFKGEVFSIDENLARKINHLNNLKSDIDSKFGYVTKEEGDLVTSLKNNQVANINLKNDLLSKVSDVSDLNEKARILYLELNRKLHYSMDFVTGEDSIQKYIYDNTVTFENLNDNKTVICKGWSELYKDLLVSAGFKENAVSIRKAGLSDITHNWIEIDLGDGNIIIADATEAINKQIDLSAAKSGMATSGFLCVPESHKGERISSAIKKQMFTDDELSASNKLILAMDQKHGYASEKGYLQDEIRESKKLFGSNSIVSDVFEGDAFEEVTKIPIPNGMDGYEVFSYYKKIMPNIIGDEAKNVNYMTIYNNVDGIVEPVFVLSYNNMNSPKIMIYGEKVGKQIFDKQSDYSEFVHKNLNLVNIRK